MTVLPSLIELEKQKLYIQYEDIQTVKWERRLKQGGYPRPTIGRHNLSYHAVARMIARNIQRAWVEQALTAIGRPELGGLIKRVGTRAAVVVDPQTKTIITIGRGYESQLDIDDRLDELSAARQCCQVPGCAFRMHPCPVHDDHRENSANFSIMFNLMRQIPNKHNATDDGPRRKALRAVTAA